MFREQLSLCLVLVELLLDLRDADNFSDACAKGRGEGG